MKKLLEVPERKGRGKNALSAREARSWTEILKRIERIAARASGAGGSTFCRLSQTELRLPVKAVRF